MKVIFLDVDGVLNYMGLRERAPNGCIGVADAPMQVLKQIVDQTGAKIVLTSTWKKDWARSPEGRTADGEYLNSRLASVGLEIMDKTTDDMTHRGRGINEWIAAHPDVTNWIVLDDEVYIDFMNEGIMPRLVQTSFYNNGGLHPKHIARCIRMLNEESKNGN